MRYLFRTSYRQDLRAWRHGGDLFWYGLLMVVCLIIPLVMGEFYVGELGGVLHLRHRRRRADASGRLHRTDQSGSRGVPRHRRLHELGLLAQGVPFLVTLPVAGLFTADLRRRDRPADAAHERVVSGDRHLAFGGIVGTVFQKWTAVTGGFDGFAVPTPYVFGISVEGATGVYYVSFAVLLFVLWLSVNLLRSPIGRAMVAIRDSEVSAQSMGINLAKYKTLAFAISAGITGLAGALVRALRSLPGARCVRRAAVGAIRHHRVRRRPWIVARRDSRRDFRPPVAAGHRHNARRSAVRHWPVARAWSRLCSASCWCWSSCSSPAASTDCG
jgi:branched-chain amino acid transport system permease protein